ncbi:hypothetical protein DITRI_Ditri15bG0040700 [Diplodiscus trichospermus]
MVQEDTHILTASGDQICVGFHFELNHDERASSAYAKEADLSSTDTDVSILLSNMRLISCMDGRFETSGIQFWHQEWSHGMILRFVFPRIYALALIKDGKVKDHGCFENGRKYLIDHDWSHSDWNKVWSDMVPPKVATFCWQMLRRSIAVKEVLASRAIFSSLVGLLGTYGLRGVLCGTSVGLAKSCHGLSSLNGVKFYPQNVCDKVWRISFYAIVWSIWLFRNEVVFQGKRMGLD